MVHRGRLRRLAFVIAATVFAAGSAAWPALAEPATSVAYPAWASATMYSGQAFDTCTAPPLASAGLDGIAVPRHRGVCGRREPHVCPAGIDR
jgi:hypothetical protein